MAEKQDAKGEDNCENGASIVLKAAVGLTFRV